MPLPWEQAGGEGQVPSPSQAGSSENARGETEVVKEVSETVKRCRQAAERGDVDAMCRLGYMLHTGEEGIAKDMPAAAALYKRAAELGNARAMCGLGYLLQYGEEGVPKDVLAAAALYKQAAEGGNAAAMCNLGFMLRYGEEGVPKDVPAAVALYKQAAERGNVHAMTSLGFMLRHGKEGVAKDVPAAAALYKQAAELGNAAAMINLGILLLCGKEGVAKDVPAAAALYKQAAELGDALAMHNLGVLLARGEEGVAKDVPAAAALYKQAAERGNALAMFNLGSLLACGAEGVAKEVSAAAALFKQAAELGDADAMYNLGVLLALGEEGVTKDVPAAAALYKQAAELGNADAMINLGFLLQRGEEGVMKDVSAAAALYKQAAELGNARAMYNLGVLLLRGKEGVAKDVPAAVALYKQAAELGNADAMYILGVLLLCGEEGVMKDVSAAAALYKQAAEGGNVLAMNNLGTLLQHGEKGVAKDVPAAAALYKQAAELGDATAMYNLGSLLGHGEEGVAKDVPAAAALYKQAAERGYALAMHNLGILLARGEEGVAEDLPAAAALFKQAAELGHAGAMSNFASCLECGIGTRRDVTGALEQLERAVQICDISDSHCMKKQLASQLLSEDIGKLRDPSRAAELLERALEESPTYGPALHELAVLYSAGDDGVPQNRGRATSLHSLAASKSSYEGILLLQAGRTVIEAGENYPDVVEDTLRNGFAKPKTCLLLALGGGGRGKTSTMNSLRGIPFVSRHEPTVMAALSKFVTEPGVRGLAEDMIAEFDFNENSLRASVSRLPNDIVSKVERQSRNQSAGATMPSKLVQTQGSNDDITERAHADVTERVRRSLVQDSFPVGFKGSVVQVWDMAGQSQYEMAHSMVIARGSILVFVTDLGRVADECTRESEVGLLCYWMQLAHILVPDPSRVPVVVVGTRKGNCGEDIVEILKDCVAKQLAKKVYDSWIRKPLGDRVSADIPKFIAIENSESVSNPEDSGRGELEKAVKAAGDEVVASRGAVPLRWLALVDKLERESGTSARIYFSREDIRELSVGFPGFTDDEYEREGDVLEGLRCFAGMGRLVLFERGDEEWYVFMAVEKIIELVGKVTEPEERLRDCLCAEDIRGLKQGRISQSALFILWHGYEEEEKKLMVKLLCEFDLLMLLEGGEESVDKGEAIVGVPALMMYGWEDFTWGSVAGEKDVEVTTNFAEALPNGLIGSLVAHMHRAVAFVEATVHGERCASPMVRANGALLRVRDGSRVFVGFKGAERQLFWRIRGLSPVRLARKCLREVEEFLNKPLRVIDVVRRHVVLLECVSSRGGCGASGSVEIELSKAWIFSESGNRLPTNDVFCKNCLRPWRKTWWEDLHWLLCHPWRLGSAFVETVNTAVPVLLWPGADESARDVGGMERVMRPRRYDVFISHAGPDKLTLAEPLYKSLEWHKVHAFLDMEGLQINEDTAPEAMVRAMSEARIGIFILSPEFAGREWTLKELCHFLDRYERCRGDGVSRPVLLPVFYRLSIGECWTIYREDSEHQEVLRKSGFFKSERQARCSTEVARAALQGLTRHSGVEVERIGGGENLSSAAVVAETVRRVVDFMRREGLL